MAANLQIFMTNTASHCKGMWNLCVISALKKTIYFVSTPREHMSVSTENHMAATFTLISICLSFQDLQRKREECLGKVNRFFTVSTSRSRLEHLCVLTDHQKKNIETFPPSEVKELPGIWDVCLFMKSESFDTFGPHTCLRMRVGNQPFFQGKTLSNLQPFVTFCLQGDVQLLADKHPRLRGLNRKDGASVQRDERETIERIFRQNILIGWDSLFPNEGEPVNQSFTFSKALLSWRRFQYSSWKILVSSLLAGRVAWLSIKGWKRMK